MPMWRCPHCGTPQAETARCWVCRRSSTTCSTCRHYRRSIAAQLGYCGLDRQRAPLAGTELRGCWEAGSVRAAGALPAAANGQPAEEISERPSPALRLRDFVPIELAGRDPVLEAPPGDQIPDASTPTPAPVAGSWAERATLFVDSEL